MLKSDSRVLTPKATSFKMKIFKIRKLKTGDTLSDGQPQHRGKCLARSSSALWLCSPLGAQEQAGALTGKAVINVLLTVHAAEAWRTFAHVAALGVMAETVVHAGLGDTLINVDGTPLTCKQGGNEQSSLWKSIPTQKFIWGLSFSWGGWGYCKDMLFGLLLWEVPSGFCSPNKLPPRC